MTESNEKKTLHQLASEHDQLSPPAQEGSPYLCEHRVAALVHGWTHHEFHYGPVTLTSEDYLAALKAAMCGQKHDPAVPVAPSEAEIAFKHAAALAESSEPEQVAKRKAAAEAKDKALADAAGEKPLSAKAFKTAAPAAEDNKKAGA